MVTIVAISGSLRKLSKNTALLNAIQDSVNDNIKMIYYDISDIPLFNEDLEEPSNIPDSVTKLIEVVRNADGLLLAVPENNFMPSAPIKNVLDWLSRGRMESPLQNKVVAMVSAGGNGGGKLAQEIMRNSFNKMSSWIKMNVISETVNVNVFDRKMRFDSDNRLIDPIVKEELQVVIDKMTDAITSQHSNKLNSANVAL